MSREPPDPAGDARLTSAQLISLAERVVGDADFRARLRTNPAKALREATGWCPDFHMEAAAAADPDSDWSGGLMR